jgi:homoserine trans-succinylase
MLIKHSVKNITTKKPIKEHIKFFRTLIRQYVQTMLQEFKNVLRLFDKDFREQKAKYEKMQQLKVDLNRALKILRVIDANMVKIGKSRQQRRQFWRDFYSGKVRNELFNDLEKDLQ